MNYVKILSINDWPQIEKKISKLKIFRIAQTKHEISKEEYMAYTYNSFVSQNEIVYGYMDYDDIISITSVYNFKAVPGYLLKNFKHFQEFNLYDPVKNGTSVIMNKIIEDQEKKHLYSFWMAKTANYKRLNQERIRKKMFDIGCPKLKYYDITIEELVPANSRSKYRLHDEGIYFGNTINEDTCVIRCTCRQEFRNNVDNNLKNKLINK